MSRPSGLIAVAAVLAACNAPDPPHTGGTHVAPGSCGRGIVVVGTDYGSTNVSLVGIDGAVLVQSFVSSAGTVALSAHLSGDVVVPTVPTTGRDIVLIDRKLGVLSFANVETGDVERQLLVGAGQNPHDYLELDAARAAISRYDRDAQGQGGDLLLVTPNDGSSLGTIPLDAAMVGEDPKFSPTPSRLLKSGSDVLVTLDVEDPSHTESGQGRLARVDPVSGAVSDFLPLKGLHECNGIALSPDASRVAVACSGSFNGVTDSNPAESAVVLVSLSPKLEEVARFPASASPFGFSVAWASGHTLLAVTLGGLDASGLTTVRKDALVEIAIDDGSTRTVLESSGAFKFGDVRCLAACGACFLADLGPPGVVHRFAIDADGHAGDREAISPDPAIGLPPYLLGQF